MKMQTHAAHELQQPSSWQHSQRTNRFCTGIRHSSGLRSLYVGVDEQQACTGTL